VLCAPGGRTLDYGVLSYIHASSFLYHTFCALLIPFSTLPVYSYHAFPSFYIIFDPAHTLMFTFDIFASSAFFILFDLYCFNPTCTAPIHTHTHFTISPSIRITTTPLFFDSCLRSCHTPLLCYPCYRNSAHPRSAGMYIHINICTIIRRCRGSTYYFSFPLLPCFSTLRFASHETLDLQFTTSIIYIAYFPPLRCVILGRWYMEFFGNRNQ
jgi:hypothetical protein